MLDFSSEVHHFTIFVETGLANTEILHLSEGIFSLVSSLIQQVKICSGIVICEMLKSEWRNQTPDTACQSSRDSGVSRYVNAVSYFSADLNCQLQ